MTKEIEYQVLELIYFIILFIVNTIVELYLNANYYLYCIERTEKG